MKQYGIARIVGAGLLVFAIATICELRPTAAAPPFVTTPSQVQIVGAAVPIPVVPQQASVVTVSASDTRITNTGGNAYLDLYEAPAGQKLALDSISAMVLVDHGLPASMYVSLDGLARLYVPCVFQGTFLIGYSGGTTTVDRYVCNTTTRAYSGSYAADVQASLPNGTLNPTPVYFESDVTLSGTLIAAQ
jgi:hypothetical protein